MKTSLNPWSVSTFTDSSGSHGSDFGFKVQFKGHSRFLGLGFGVYRVISEILQSGLGFRAGVLEFGV